MGGFLKYHEGVDKILFIDAFSGIAGDMLVAALLDLGIPLTVFEEALGLLSLEGYTIDIQQAKRSGITACRFVVVVDQSQPQRSYSEIKRLLIEAELPTGAKELALKAFEILGKAEASVHGIPIDKVHFHEVGAVDSIVDIVAAAVGLDWLGARVIASPLPMGRGTVLAQHGILPLPAPATVECLRDIPTYDAGIDAELVTPTGACLIAAAATTFSRWPDIQPQCTGWGSGTQDLIDRPNLLRLVLGTSVDVRPSPEAHSAETNAPFVVLEANIDDMSPEIAAYAMECALEAGALDVWTTPILMKKGRQALMLSVLVRRSESSMISAVLFSETTTLGVRIRPSYRIERSRHIVIVRTAYGAIPVKVAGGDGLPRNLAPEFEDCRLAAKHHGVPIKQVFTAALAAAEAV